MGGKVTRFIIAAARRRGALSAKAFCVAAAPPWAGLVFASVLMLSSMHAAALEISGGVSVGGMTAGTVPRLAVTPHAGVSWRTESGLLLGVHDMFSLLPATNAYGPGAYNQVSAAVGYAWETGDLRVGPSLALYTLPACAAAWCGRVNGLAPGAQAQGNLFFAGPLGLSLSANVDWLIGSSGILHGGVAAMFLAGPVVRWIGR